MLTMKEGIIVMFLGASLMMCTAFYMYYGVSTHTSYEQPAITPAGLFVGFVIMFLAMGYTEDPKLNINDRRTD